MRARLLALLAPALLAACGDTLVDHRAPELFAPELPPTVITSGAACDTSAHCGSPGACVACADPVGLSSSARATCVAVGDTHACSYECADGLLKCNAGCCRAARVHAGEGHSCAVTTGGGLHCWGANGDRQVNGLLGATVPSPVKLYESGVGAVALGVAHTCAVISGAVECWGRNLEGQAPAPGALAAVTNVVALAAGLTHTCALDDAGAVRCWGTSGFGQAGDPAGGVATVLTGAAALTAGRDHTCAVLTTGEVSCFGSNAAAQLAADPAGLASTAAPRTAIAAGISLVASRVDLACAAVASPTREGGFEDQLRCWGSGLGASYGLVDPQIVPTVPMRDANTSVIRFGGGASLGAIAVGRTHVCVQKSPAAGELIQCLGATNALGQLGGTPPGPGEAVGVGPTAGSPSFAAGDDHTCAVIDATGGVQCWGSNALGQLGSGTLTAPFAVTPVPVEVPRR